MKALKKLNIQKTYQVEWNAFRLDGNMNALSVIYEDNFDLLLNYGRKFCHEESVIEDAIQNIFTNLIRSREKLGEINSIKPYLMIAHRNELFKLINKSRNIVIIENLPDIIFKPEYSIEEEIIEQEGQTRLKKFLKNSLQKLTSHQQEALYLKYDVGLSYADISKTLNISVESCRTTIYRSIKLIRADVESLKKDNINLFFPILRTVLK
jgi:RNA polymerase sigma factor (sigma-70 family)